MLLASCYAETERGDSEKNQAEIVKEPTSKMEPAEVADSDNDPGCIANEVKNGALPAMVLVGADVQDRSTFATSTVKASRYSIDMGGAIVSVEIKPGAASTYNIRRTYQEPGIPDDVRVIDSACTSVTQLRSGSVLAEFVEEGVLWLELDAQNPMISNELWMLLTEEQ